MEKKNTYSKWMAVVLLACVCGLVSCRAEYEVTKVEGTRGGDGRHLGCGA